MKGEIATGLALILLGIGLVLITPFILIWSINGLFALAIQYTWTNWFYAFVIVCLVRGNLTSNSK